MTPSSCPAARKAPLSFEELVARLGESPRIGTSSVRRTAQLSRLFPGATFLPIRGNLDTRLRKVDDGEYDAIVLASAGLIRLEHRARISAVLPVPACVPAPGQGIIAIEIREGDQRVAGAIGTVDDQTAKAALDAERAVVTKLGGGCQMPIGAHAEVTQRLDQARRGRTFTGRRTGDSRRIARAHDRVTYGWTGGGRRAAGARRRADPRGRAAGARGG